MPESPSNFRKRFLVLVMPKFFFLAAIFLLVSCNNHEETEPVLTKAPYNTLTDSIKLEPNNADLYYRRGVLLYQNEQKGLAAADLRKAWNITPKEQYALSLTTLLRDKNADSAILFLQGAIDRYPNSIALHIGLARGYQQKGDLQKALTICNQLLSAFPNQLDALLLKAELLKGLNQTDEEIATLEKAYSYAPLDKEVAYKLAFDYAETKNSKVLTLTNNLSKIDSLAAEPYYFKGIYFSNMNNSAEAIRSFDKAIQKDFYFLNAHINKGIVYYDNKQFNYALKTFALVAKISPSNDEAYYWLAKTQEALGDKQNAKANYQRAYALNKENTEAKAATDKL